MPHDVTLLSTITIGFIFAFVLGYIANRVGFPPLVGYLLAGVALGPFNPGFVADTALAGQLAEIGVILLMFGVGLHFSIADLAAVRRIAVPGAIAQIIIATILGAAVSQMLGWSLGASLILSLSLSVASTVVLLKTLEGRNALGTTEGRIAVGWLIVEDLATVLVLVLLPALAGVLGGTGLAESVSHSGNESLFVTLGLTVVRVVAFGAIVLLVGPRFLPWALRQVARTGSRELFTLAVLTLSIGIAFAAAKFFDVSFALGAFFAGVVLNESDLSHKAAANSLPLQDAFAVLFFVSVGMLFDPSIMVRQPLMVAGVVGFVVVGKYLIALGVVTVMGLPATTGLTIAASLAQVGEFSFILAGLGISYGLLPQDGLSLILAGALFSIPMNPLLFAATERLNEFLRKKAWSIEFAPARLERMNNLRAELESARVAAEKKAGGKKVFTPDELIERFPMFSQLSPEQREAMLLHFQPHTAQPGDRVIRAGDKADAVYFISSGELEVLVGNRRIKLGPGSFFGEMAFLSGKPRSADVTALGYCKCLKLARSDFRNVLRQFPDVRKQMVQLASERVEMNRRFKVEEEFELHPA